MWCRDKRSLVAGIAILVAAPASHVAWGADPAYEREMASAVELVRSGHLDDAAVELERVALLHPGRPEPWRELAGVRFTQRRWNDAARAAECALTRDPSDGPSWHLLGASRYMLDQRDEALEAWNEIDGPTVTGVRVDGPTGTHPELLTETIGISRHDLLTARSVRHARRRLELVPSVAASRVEYRPGGTAGAELEIAVMERSSLRHGWMAIGISGARAILERTVRLSIPWPARSGSMWEASYRWWEHRPRAHLAVETPGLPGLRGNLRIEASAERQTYGSRGSTTSPVLEERTGECRLSFRQWAAPDWLYEASAGVRHIVEHGDYLSVGGALEWRRADDRCLARAGVSAWPRIDRDDDLITTAGVEARGGAQLDAGFEATGHLGWSGVLTGSSAPRGLWSGAGTGEGRPGLLRAHPLLRSGVIAGPAFAPALALAGVEVNRWLDDGARLAGLAAFVDAARITGSRPSNGGQRQFVDAGIGVRLRAPGERAVFRMDFAFGLADRSSAFSAALRVSRPSVVP